MDKCGIYAIECLRNGAFYIGSSVGISNRWYAHRRILSNGRHHSPRFQHCWDKYGQESFRLTILEECLPDQLLDLEQEYLDAFRPPLNVCQSARSRAGSQCSEETKEKIRQARLGVKFTDEHRANISTARRASDAVKELARNSVGKKRPPETGPRISARKLGRKRTPEAIAAVVAGLRGRKLSDAHKARLSEIRKGHRVSEETREKIRAAQIGVPKIAKQPLAR